LLWLISNRKRTNTVFAKAVLIIHEQFKKINGFFQILQSFGCCVIKEMLVPEKRM